MFIFKSINDEMYVPIYTYIHSLVGSTPSDYLWIRMWMNINSNPQITCGCAWVDVSDVDIAPTLVFSQCAPESTKSSHALQR